MAIPAVLTSSKTPEWATPQYLYDLADDEFGLTLDVCANRENHKAPNYFGLDHPDADRRDGLAADWAAELARLGGCGWMNPVYGSQIGFWVKKAFDTGQAGHTMVCLPPANTDTQWWHRYCMNGEVRLIKGRLKFGGSKTPAPFPSAFVIFGPRARAGLVTGLNIDDLRLGRRPKK